MCWSTSEWWEERELVKDEERREDEDRRTVQFVAEHEAPPPEREPETERELVRV
jgi:hypothetical protein